MKVYKDIKECVTEMIHEEITVLFKNINPKLYNTLSKNGGLESKLNEITNIYIAERDFLYDSIPNSTRNNPKLLNTHLLMIKEKLQDVIKQNII